MSKQLVAENFESIHELISILRSRPNNEVMDGKDSSSSDDYDFTGSNSYEESEKLIREGYKEILPKVRENMCKIEKSLKPEFTNVPKVRPRNSIIGYVPNVPNAILGLPESMIDSVRIPQKQKTIDIVYVMGGNCGTDKQLWVDAGTTLLSAINVLESNRISVKLKVCFFLAESDGEMAFSTVTIKNYAQRLDLQKICFPMAHPSMFRRFGFKWLETCPNIKDRSFRFGYGRSPVDSANSLQKFIDDSKLDKSQRIISAQMIEQLKFDLKSVLNFLKTNNNGC